VAFDELMLRYEHQIYRVCYRLVGHREYAMDIAQEVFIKAFEHLRSFPGESSIKSWLYRIAMNQCINHLKKKNVEVAEFTGCIESSSQSELEKQERRQVLRRMLKSLPSKATGNS
jgi:RNA polymerase sigma-70 factor (ECF subfamily)